MHTSDLVQGHWSSSVEDDCNCSAEHITNYIRLKQRLYYITNECWNLDQIMSCPSWLCYGDSKALIHNTARTATTLPKLLSHTASAATTHLHYCCVPVLHSAENYSQHLGVTTQPGLQPSLWHRQENSLQPEQPSCTFWLHNRIGDRDPTACCLIV